jgi:fumarate reductase flavoprotein subunit
MSPTDTLFRRGAILVDSTGERFGHEASPAAELAMRPGGRGFVLLDKRIAAEFDIPPQHISTAPGIAFAYFKDYRKGRPDLVTTASSVAELARALGFDPALLEASIASSSLTAPFIALGPVHSMLTVTEGSVAIDERMRPLRPDGSVIPGLFAVGGVGQGGMLLKGHGHHIGWAMTSGRLVGESVAGLRPDPASFNIARKGGTA